MFSGKRLTTVFMVRLSDGSVIPETAWPLRNSIIIPSGAAFCVHFTAENNTQDHSEKLYVDLFLYNEILHVIWHILT